MISQYLTSNFMLIVGSLEQCFVFFWLYQFCISFLLSLSLPCRQVLDWLNNHGDGFLEKNTAVGKSLQKAKALQKNQEHFESVASVSSKNKNMQF